MLNVLRLLAVATIWIWILFFKFILSNDLKNIMVYHFRSENALSEIIV